MPTLVSCENASPAAARAPAPRRRWEDDSFDPGAAPTKLPPPLPPLRAPPSRPGGGAQEAAVGRPPPRDAAGSDGEMATWALALGVVLAAEAPAPRPITDRSRATTLPALDEDPGEALCDEEPPPPQQEPAPKVPPEADVAASARVAEVEVWAAEIEPPPPQQEPAPKVPPDAEVAAPARVAEVEVRSAEIEPPPLRHEPSTAESVLNDVDVGLRWEVRGAAIKSDGVAAPTVTEEKVKAHLLVAPTPAEEKVEKKHNHQLRAPVTGQAAADIDVRSPTRGAPAGTVALVVPLPAEPGAAQRVRQRMAAETRRSTPSSAPLAREEVHATETERLRARLKHATRVRVARDERLNASLARSALQVAELLRTKERDMARLRSEAAQLRAERAADAARADAEATALREELAEAQRGAARATGAAAPQRATLHHDRRREIDAVESAARARHERAVAAERAAHTIRLDDVARRRRAVGASRRGVDGAGVALRLLELALLQRCASERAQLRVAHEEQLLRLEARVNALVRAHEARLKAWYAENVALATCNAERDAA